MSRQILFSLILPCALGACLTRVPPIPVEPERMAFDVQLGFVGYSVTTRCESGELVMQIDEAHECLQMAYEERAAPARQAGYGTVLLARLVGGSADADSDREDEALQEWPEDITRVQGASSEPSTASATTVMDGDAERTICLLPLAGQPVVVNGVSHLTDAQGEVRLAHEGADASLAQIGERWVRATCEGATEVAAP